jgi:hypothetical protein
MKLLNWTIAIVLCTALLAGCNNADKFVMVVGSISPPLNDCAAFVDTPSQVFDKREVKGKYMLRYLVGSADASIGVEIRCGAETHFKQRLSPIPGTVDVGDL